MLEAERAAREVMPSTDYSVILPGASAAQRLGNAIESATERCSCGGAESQAAHEVKRSAELGPFRCWMLRTQLLIIHH